MSAGFVVITPARNEARFIVETLNSMVQQLVLPIKWVIVSDGSTDGTDEIVNGYISRYPWIELVQLPERRERNFAGKVHAFNSGYARVKDVPHDVVVSLDADISFDSEYFGFLLEKLAADPSLGLVGTPFQELTGQSYDYRFVSIEHVSGACQVFRRECFEAIGGYVPVKGGSIDHIAVLSARMKGWKTRTFTEKVCIHHREIGTAERGVLGSRFKAGIKDHKIGNHPMWEIFRVGYQMTLPPRCIGALALGAGYFWSLLRRNDRIVSDELIHFHRGEQMLRLKKFLKFRVPTSPLARGSSDPRVSSH